jgi:hypothetical protein
MKGISERCNGVFLLVEGVLCSKYCAANTVQQLYVAGLLMNV